MCDAAVPPSDTTVALPSVVVVVVVDDFDVGVADAASDALKLNLSNDTMFMF